MSDSLRPHGLSSSWNSPGQNTGVGSLSLLQGIFPTQGLNPGLPHCRGILYQLSQKGCPRIMESEWRILSLLQMFLTQESNQSLLHCRQILYQLSHQGSPTIQVWPKSNPLHLHSGNDKQIQGIRSDSVPEELWTELHDIVQEAVIKTIPKKKK